LDGRESADHAQGSTVDAPQLTARSASQNGVANIELTGELDLATVPVLEGHLAPFENDGVAAIVLDLRSLIFTDTTGIHAFLRARDRIATSGRQLVVVGATPPVRRVFELTGTDALLDDRNTAGVLDRFTGGRAGRKVHGDV
jgi:anti-sigma B factor antagonist